MFCVNCFHPTTSVTNSRPNKKQPLIWRRRRCQKCGTIFTTHERPSLADNKAVQLPDGKEEIFNLGKLIISISKAFAHLPKEASYNSLWLAQTVEDTLSSQSQVIPPGDIEAATQDVLRRFDELAAVQYAARHHMIISTRRRGRPSWRGPEPPTPPSLSL